MSEKFEQIVTVHLSVHVTSDQYDTYLDTIESKINSLFTSEEDGFVFLITSSDPPDQCDDGDFD